VRIIELAASAEVSLGQFGRKRKVVDGAVLTEKSKELRSVLKALFDWSEAQEIALRAK